MPLIGVDLKDAIYLIDTGHRHTLAQRGLETVTKAFDVLYNLVLDHETGRIVAPIGKIRQLALPVRRHQTETVPAVLFPGVEPLVALKHDVIDACLAQVIGC
jgi:hypothetical protein